MRENKVPEALTRLLYAKSISVNHTRAQEIQLREYIRTRDLRAVDYAVEMFDPSHGGIVHRDPRISQLYRGIGSVTMLTRFCIDAGMPEQKAYTISDFLLQQLEPDFSAEQVKEWYRKALTIFISMIPVPVNETSIENIQGLSRIVTRAMQYCLDHPTEPLQLQQVSKVLFISDDYLSKCFKEQTGVTFTRFVRHLKAVTARDMLQYTDLSAAEIASTLSFSSQSYFIRIFKEEYGMTPGEYKKQQLSGKG